MLYKDRQADIDVDALQMSLQFSGLKLNDSQYGIDLFLEYMDYIKADK